MYWEYYAHISSNDLTANLIAVVWELSMSVYGMFGNLA